MNEQETCPECMGHKGISFHSLWGGFNFIPCTYCDGTGVISAEKAEQRRQELSQQSPNASDDAPPENIGDLLWLIF